MRIIEIVLMLINFISLFLGFKMNSKIARLLLAGVNLSVLSIHGIFEGFRYQMAFSYIFVILFVAYTLVKTTNNKYFEAKLPKTLKVIAITLSLIFLLCSSYLAYALPVFTMPKPTGNDDVGVKYFHLVDDKRTEPFLEKSTQKRELMVKIRR